MDFRNSTGEISINLINTGIRIPHTPINLHSGEKQAPIVNEQYTLTLFPHGYVMLAVENGMDTSVFHDRYPDKGVADKGSFLFH